MEDGVDGHGFAAIFVEHREWKASDQAPPVICMDSSVHFRIAADGLDAGINTT